MTLKSLEYKLYMHEMNCRCGIKLLSLAHGFETLNRVHLVPLIVLSCSAGSTSLMMAYHLCCFILHFKNRFILYGPLSINIVQLFSISVPKALKYNFSDSNLLWLIMYRWVFSLLFLIILYYDTLRNSLCTSFVKL